MSEFSPKIQEFEEILDDRVIVSEMEDGSEQRRPRAAGAVTGFRIMSPPMTKAQADTLRAFWVSKKGRLIVFTFTSPNDGLEYSVRFDSPLNIKGKPRLATEGVYTANYSLKVVK